MDYRDIVSNIFIPIPCRISCYLSTKIRVLCCVEMVGAIHQGKSAKYCTYSLMDSETNKIVYMDIVNKHVALKSPNIERGI